MRKQIATLFIAALAAASFAQNDPWPQYGGNAQHQAVANAPLQHLNHVIWSMPLDKDPQYNSIYLLWHYTPPMLTQRGNIVAAVKTSATGDYVVEGHKGSNGALTWSMPTDYILPAHDWGPVCGLALVSTAGYGVRSGLVVAGAGGTLINRSDADNASAVTRRLCFYGVSNHTNNQAAMDSSVFINTPLTVDSSQNIYFGYQVTGSNPMGLVSGIARVNSSGVAKYNSLKGATNGKCTGYISQNCAPALSPDGSTLYFAAKNTSGTTFLTAVDSQTLAYKASVQLLDPVTHLDAHQPDDGSATPFVAPNGDVFYGVLENPFAHNVDRGYLLHFNAQLQNAGAPGNFGWDDTPSLVPASAVPSYSGTSPFLILCKYNNYYGFNGGDGHNRIAVLDPFDAGGYDPLNNIAIMKEVISVLGVTQDSGAPQGSVREWCVNSSSVDPVTKSALINSEDGSCYRWDFTTNSLTEALNLTSGIGESYTTTMIGPDGRGYAISNAVLYVVGSN